MENEKRLIDANDVYSLFEKNGTAKLHVGDIDVIQRVDAVEVVRCKDCIVPHNEWTGCPKLNGLKTTSDFYCPYGKGKRMDELKPCPFCGGDAAFVGDTRIIKCKRCGGAFICANPLITTLEVKNAWNRRVDRAERNEI